MSWTRIYLLSVISLFSSSFSFSWNPTNIKNAAQKAQIQIKTPSKFRGTKAVPLTLPDLSQKEFPQYDGVYDLIVIGSGPGGEAAAVRASQLGAKKVAVIERKSAFGGPTGELLFVSKISQFFLFFIW